MDSRKVNQKAGPMGDRRTKRQRDRSTRERIAVAGWTSGAYCDICRDYHDESEDEPC